MKMCWLVGCAILAVAAPAWAGETPIYQPAPAWIAPAPAIDPATMTDATPFVVRYDSQQRIERGVVWTYLDVARRASSAEILGQIGTFTVPWLPDKGDLIVHQAEILRGSEHIDLLKTGTRFTVLRREENLEQRQLTGALTATLAVQGLQIGDVLRVSYSTTTADAALKGHGQSIGMTPAEPNRIGFGRAMVSWPATSGVHWKLMTGDTVAAPGVVGGYRTLKVALPLPKPDDLPTDMPARFLRPPLLAATDFADWADVSRTMAPLFATEGLIAPGSALAAEVEKIKAADATPLGRSERALELVQDKIRYLALGMNGGNYVPQTPAQTWELRYGDCKAKTLMLLAMLRAMGIEAEATLASAQNGDLVSAWLPMPAAFNHVLVRATIGGESLWLDGTGMGARLADIHDTPAFGYVLPLRPAGSGLMPVPIRPDARPEVDVALDIDESAGVDYPRVFHATLTVRGSSGAAFNTLVAQAAPKQRHDMIAELIGRYTQAGQVAETAARYDSASGTGVFTASGVLTTGWHTDDKRLKQELDHAISSISFAPDRARAKWRDIPVTQGDFGSTAWHTRITLAGGATGYTLEGDRTLSGVFGGATLTRATALAGQILSVDDLIVPTGAEIAPAALAAERAHVSTAQARMLRAIAPVGAQRRWDIVTTGRTDPRFRTIEAMFARAIATDTTEASGYQSRASFRAGIFDRRGAIEDLGKAIGIDPSEDLYLNRARLHLDLDETALAMTDVKAALALNPSSFNANLSLIGLLSDSGDAKGALALAEERIALGGREMPDYVRRKAETQADGGDTSGGLATLDAAIVEKPGDPDLLNARCWIKGTRNTALDTALKDCTKSIELSDNPNAALDSRAMVYFRMGRNEDALADLDAVIEAAPGSAGSRFLRGAILRKSGKAGQAETDLRIARLISPQVDRIYKKYGITA